MKRILVADDKATSRELIRVVLEHSGYEVDEAADGSEALVQAQRHPPDLILLDLQMPKLDGFAVLAELQRDARFAGLPVVALTAFAMQGDRERVLAAGFTSYLTKPVNLVELRRHIAGLIGASARPMSSGSI